MSRHDLLARFLADHPHPAASYDAVHIRFAKPVNLAIPAPHGTLPFDIAGDSEAR